MCEMTFVPTGKVDAESVQKEVLFVKMNFAKFPGYYLQRKLARICTTAVN